MRKKRRRALIASLIAGALVIGFVVVAVTRPPALGESGESSLGGKTAPSISGPDIESGRPIDLAGARGKFVVLDFFASWCAPCEEEAPQLVAFLYQHRLSHDVAVIGVDIDDSASDGRAFLQRVGATWPAIEDANGVFAERYGVTNPPESFVISPAGKVIGVVSSGVSASSLDALIDAERAVS